MTDRIFGIHADTLRFRAERAQVLAANMANADTPGYKARDLDFKAIFSPMAKSEPAMKMTDASHLSPARVSMFGKDLQYRTPFQPAVDGNTVDVQIERSEFMQNTMMYQASLRFINGRISGLLTAIRGE